MTTARIEFVNATCDACGDEGKVFWNGNFAEDSCFACNAPAIYLTKVGN